MDIKLFIAKVRSFFNTPCITYFQSSDVYVLWSSHHLFRLLALFLVIRGLVIAALPWTLDLWSSPRTVLVEKGLQELILSTAVSFGAAFLWFLYSMLFDLRRFLSLSFGFRPLFLLADDAFPWFMYAIITLANAALDRSNEMPVCFLMFQLNSTNRLSCLKIWRFFDFAVLSREFLLNAICNALKLTLYSVNKQKNN